MAQMDRRQRKGRLLSRLGGRVKPGVAALLTAGVVAGGAIGVSQSGFSHSFDVDVDTHGDEAVSALSAEETTIADTRYIVHVDGAVLQPGVYELIGNDLRIRDAIEAAGGLLEGADTSGVNLAAPVVDGSKVHIPTHEEVEAVTAGGSTWGGTSNAGSTALVNINSASIDQLCTLSGIGEATAANIIADREQNGPFTCIEDLMRVSGIGEKKFERVKDSICV